MKAIKKDTALITAAAEDNNSELGLSAKNIINYLVYAIQQEQIEKDEDGWYTVGIKKMKEELGFAKNKAIKKGMLQLQNLQLIYDQSGKYENEDIEERTAFSFLRVVKYKWERWKKWVYKFKVEDMLEEAIERPYLYTRLHLRITRGFKNKYAINIYEIAKDYLPVRNKQMKIQRFRQLLWCGYENNITLFFKRVMKPATREINRKTEINVNYEKIKEGRSYKYIKFKFSYKNADIRNKLVSEYEVHEQVVDQIMIKFMDDIDILKKLLKEIKWEYKQGNINKLGGYTYTQLVNKVDLKELRKKKEKETKKKDKPLKRKSELSEEDKKRRKKAAKKHLGKWLKNVDNDDN